MDTSFDYILKSLQEEYELMPNVVPPILVHGGTYNSFDLSSQVKYNTQIVLVANEFKQDEGYFVSERVRHTLEENLGVRILPFQYNELDALEKVLDGFSKHFSMELDKAKIIRKLNQRHRDTFYTLYVGVLLLPYYELELV